MTPLKVGYCVMGEEVDDVVISAIRGRLGNYDVDGFLYSELRKQDQIIGNSPIARGSHKLWDELDSADMALRLLRRAMP